MVNEHSISVMAGARSFLLRRFVEPARRKLLSSLRRVPPDGLNIACFCNDLIGRHIIEDGLYEQEELEAIVRFMRKQHPDKLRGAFIDVGGNIGNHALFLSPLFERVCSFEPSPVAHRLLEANIMFNRAANIIALPYGLGEYNQQLMMRLPQGNLGGASVVKGVLDQPSPLDCIYEVTIRQGDLAVAECLSENMKVGLIKIDVEGHELAVITGLGETIRQHRPIIIFESLFTPPTSVPSSVVDKLRALGYGTFFDLRHPALRSRWRLLQKLERIFRGYELQPRVLAAVAERNYALIIAVPDRDA